MDTSKNHALKPKAIFILPSGMFVRMSPKLEKKIGYTKPIFAIFFLGGIIGGLGAVFYPQVEMVFGASAGISSITGAMLLYSPKSRVNVLFFENIFPKILLKFIGDSFIHTPVMLPLPHGLVNRFGRMKSLETQVFESDKIGRFMVEAV